MERTNANASSHTCLPLGFGMVRPMAPWKGDLTLWLLVCPSKLFLLFN